MDSDDRLDLDLIPEVPQNLEQAKRGYDSGIECDEQVFNSVRISMVIAGGKPGSQLTKSVPLPTAPYIRHARDSMRNAASHITRSIGVACWAERYEATV